MRVGTRIVFSLFILIILVLCAFVLLVCLGFLPMEMAQALFYGFSGTSYKYIWAGVAAVLFVVGVCLLFFGSKRAEPEFVLLNENVEGSVSVSVSAIEELALRYLAGETGVLVQRVKIGAIGQGQIKVKLYLSAKPGVEMPAVTEKISQGIKDYLAKYVGVIVSGVHIHMMPLKPPSYGSK